MRLEHSVSFEVALLSMKLLANGHEHRSQGQRPWYCKRAKSVWPTAIFNPMVAD